MRDDPAPPQIPDYQLLRKIGQGSYGVVWLAQGVTGIYRAVKIVWRASFEDPQPYEREFRGIKEFAAVSLIEPRQLALLHVGRNDELGFFYYVMELADDAASGREIDPETYVPHTLREVRARRGRLGAEEALALGVDLAGALAGLHAHELVHRDIKPSNIIFVGGVPKLADIGLVTSAATTALTMSRVGNPGYMPPDLPGTPSADVYGLGKVLYEIATGRERDDYPRLPANLDTLPDRKALLELNEIFVRACHANPEKRYTDAAAIRDDLRLLQAGKSVRRLRAAERHLGRAMRVAAVLAVVAAIAAGGAWAQQKRAAKAEAERDALAQSVIYAATLAQAQHSLEREDYGHGLALLQSIKPKAGLGDLRGFEWRALLHEARGDHAQILWKGSAPVDRLVVARDAAILAVHDESKTTVIFDTNSRSAIARVKGIHRLADFSPDGKWLLGSAITGSSKDPEFSLHRWSVKGGALDTVALEHGVHRPIGVEIAGRLVAFRDADSVRKEPPALVIFDFDAPEASVTVPLADWVNWQFFRAALSSDRTHVLIAGQQRVEKEFRFRATVVSLQPPYRAEDFALPFRPAIVDFLVEGIANCFGWRIANETEERTLVFDAARRQFQDRSGELPLASSLAGLPRASSPPLLLAARRATLAFVDPRDPLGSGLRLHGHAANISAVAALRDGSWFFSGSADGEVRAWESATALVHPSRRQCYNIAGAHTPITFSTDGGQIFAPDDGRSVVVLETSTLRPLDRVANMRHAIKATPDGVWGLDAEMHTLVFWDRHARQITRNVGRAASRIDSVAFSRGEQHTCLFTAGEDLFAANLTDATVTPVPIGKTTAGQLLLSDDGQSFWSISNTKLGPVVACHSTHDGRLIWQQESIRGVVTSVCRVGPQDALIVATEDGLVRMFRAADGRLLRTLPMGGAAAELVTPLEDASRLLVVGLDGDLRVVETKTWLQLGLIPLGTRAKPYSIAVAPDARAAAVLTSAGMLHVVRAD